MEQHKEMIQKYINNRTSYGHTCEFVKAHKDYFLFRWVLVFTLNGRVVTIPGRKF